LLSHASHLPKIGAPAFVAQNVFCFKKVKVIKNSFVAKFCFSGNCFSITYPLFNDRKYLCPSQQAWLNIPFQGQESFGVMSYLEHVPSTYVRY
jgi:hypothetical protein